MPSRKHNLRTFALLALLTLAGLGLRLLVWRWRELQGLGGDEQEYFTQALTLLRDHQYLELRLMRPPLYTLFLAASIVVVDSLVQQLRLVQALLSTATVPLVFLLTHEVAQWSGSPVPKRAALFAAGLCAFCYTLAANATELLTETLFLFGLSAALWLLLRACRTLSWRLTALAGLAVGALCLVRSVALPLLPLGAFWVWWAGRRLKSPRPRAAWRLALIYAVCALLVIAPWTLRNYLRYGGLILIDTTGAENLWLDNDPAGREAVKAQLYALGEDRLQRQQLATRQGFAVISANPGPFAAKAWGELLKLVALEQSDDLLARRAIWVAPAEVWARLILGDALWLALLVLGSYGLTRQLLSVQGFKNRTAAPAWLLAPWALYVALTTLLFHVELRYRLPLYPILLPYAALVLTTKPQLKPRSASLIAALLPLTLLSLTLLHAPYPTLAWRLGWKHWYLRQASIALVKGDQAQAETTARAALALDEDSALARIALARAAITKGELPAALTELDTAVAAVPQHPQAHVLRGDVQRALGTLAQARTDLAYETASRQDLQSWLWERAATPASARLDLGDGLDLGFVRGAHAVGAGENGYRWTTANVELRLVAPAAAHELALRLASGRPEGSAPLPVEIWAGGKPLGSILVPPGWSELTLPLAAPAQGNALIIELRTPTFTPRQFDRASPDGRVLGVKLAWVELR